MNFANLFEQIHGHRPFPWQEEAARRLTEGEPLEAVIVPTACGKTALIDAAIFAAVHGGPKRIAFIIDRRVVVDEAYVRACKMRDASENPATAELEAFSAKLGPIQVIRLRGGVHGDDDWVIYPDRVTVLLSTVDQVGSRLLFRGYGVSPRMAPVHAGFVGNDALYLIDEAHLSSAFLDTVEAVRSHGADLRLIPLSATLSRAAEGTLALSHDDWQVPTLRDRVEASKRARLVPVAGGRAPLVDAAVREAIALGDEAPVVGIVVNRVDTARLIWKKLSRKAERVHLLTGRVRPYDRDRLLERLLPAISAGRARSGDDSLFVVATQTIEVGANLDFDALVTEAAPLSSLRQRFGRLDRLGSWRTSEATVLYPEPKRRKDKSPEPDPVYGEAVHATWAWLESVAEAGWVNFGVRQLDATVGRHPPPEEPQIRGPSLLPTHVTLLAQTGPNAPHIDVGPWLHGAGKARAEVSVIWRADLTPGEEADWPSTVRLRPPITHEAMELPFVAARSWLQGKREARFSDLEGAENLSDTERKTTEGEQRSVVRWRGAEACDVIEPAEVRPGDTLIVPAVYGGCDCFGWSPSEHTPVDDIADHCSAERGLAHIVRLAPVLCGWLGARRESVFEAVAELVEAETQEDPEIGIDLERIKAARSMLRQRLTAVDHPLLSALGKRYVIERYPAGVVLRGRVLDDFRGSLTGGVAVPLDAHLAGVEQQARAIANGHPECERIAAAAAEHDLGKREPRFQAMLHGDPLQAAVGPALAKSGLRRLRELRESYAQSGLPRGFRHEFASLNWTEEQDRLTRYLIGAHHGYGRPWVPACADSEAPGAHYAELEAHWLGVFAKLVEDVGPWRLAGMELFLRAADARQSRKEQETADG